MKQITLDGIAHSYSGKASSDSAYALKPLHYVWEHGTPMRCSARRDAERRPCSTSSRVSSSPPRGGCCSSDKDVTHLPTEQRNIAQVFQFPVIYDTMTVAENLAFPVEKSSAFQSLSSTDASPKSRRCSI